MREATEERLQAMRSWGGSFRWRWPAREVVTTAILRFKFCSGERRSQKREKRFARLVFGNELAEGGDQRGEVAIANCL